MSVFIVERDYEGFIIGNKEDKLGVRASDTRQISIDDCRVPRENLLGELNKGFKHVMEVLDGGRIGIGSLSVGLAQAAMQEAAAYAKQREAFGRAISEFQAIRWMLADMATRTEAAKLMVYQAAITKDNNQDCRKLSSMAKLMASDTAVSVASDAVQVFGGSGYIKGFAVERLYRDAKITQIYEGTNQIQRNIIAKELLK